MFTIFSDYTCTTLIKEKCVFMNRKQTFLRTSVNSREIDIKTSVILTSHEVIQYHKIILTGNVVKSSVSSPVAFVIFILYRKLRDVLENG